MYLFPETWGSKKGWRRFKWERGWGSHWGFWRVWILLWQEVKIKIIKYDISCAKPDQSCNVVTCDIDLSWNSTK